MTKEEIWKDKQENRKIITLFKSMKHEYLEDTMKEGKFCFCHPTVFNRWEDRESAQYDRWEGHSSVEAIDLYVAPIVSEKEDGTIVYGKILKLADRGIVHTQTGEAKHTPICCFRMIEQEDVEIIDEKHFSFSINGTEERIMKEFGHDTFVLIQIAPFLERIRKTVPSCYTGAVVYQDTMNKSPFTLDDKHQEIAEQIYRKDERFSWQKEYRIALEPAIEEKTFVKIGSIEDIAISGRMEDFAKNNGKITITLLGE